MSFKPFILKAAVISIEQSVGLTPTDTGNILDTVQNILHRHDIPTLIMNQSLSEVFDKLETMPGQTLFIGNQMAHLRQASSRGMITVRISHDRNDDANSDDVDFVIPNAAQLAHVIRLGSPMPIGKFPCDLLERYLDDFSFQDESVIINPGIGEDTAAIDIQSSETLILKSDPITFATDSIGYYTVLINANDIATSGAIPRWLLTTLLFPPQSTPSQAFQVMQDLKTACYQWGITLCGGHTEITDAVTRPVVTGMMAGVVERSRLLDKRNIRTGDALWITKSLAVEGTSIIAREFGDRLRLSGYTDGEINRLKEFLFSISILDEARIAADTPGVVAMHDVTEGGLASAVSELSTAGRHIIKIRMAAIPVYPETSRLCKLLKIDPLGLIASGCLLICCRPDYCQSLIDNMSRRHISLTQIGEIGPPGKGVEAYDQEKPVKWPEFATDEITRLLFGSRE
jgi:hydrogenase maturation factor